ncbi:MAG: nuclear transport factor 2 family protein [Caulobacteraceae bacterium]|nr:nuclear transport factor 2 family protein [Caulobacteraceae bacterium]
MTDSDILKRLDRVESMLAIQQLPVRYARAVDSRDVDTWVNLFVDNVRVTKEETGRPALAAWITRALRGFYRSHHFVCGHVIDFDPADENRASGTVYCRAEHEDRGKWIVMAIIYFDKYDRRDGVWYFHQRRELHWYSTDMLERPNDTPSFQRWSGHEGATPHLPAEFATWKDFWAQVDPAVVNQLTQSPV